MSKTAVDTGRRGMICHFTVADVGGKSIDFS